MYIETSDGYEVHQTSDGLAVFVNGELKCELLEKSFEDYELDECETGAVEFEIDGESIYLDEYQLEKDIELEML